MVGSGPVCLPALYHVRFRAYRRQGCPDHCTIDFYPVRNNAPLLPPGQAPPQKGSCPGGRSSGPAAAAGLDFRIIPAGFNPLRQRLRGECPAQFRVATTGISNGVYSCVI